MLICCARPGGLGCDCVPHDFEVLFRSFGSGQVVQVGFFVRLPCLACTMQRKARCALPVTHDLYAHVVLRRCPGVLKQSSGVLRDKARRLAELLGLPARSGSAAAASSSNGSSSSSGHGSSGHGGSSSSSSEGAKPKGGSGSGAGGSSGMGGRSGSSEGDKGTGSSSARDVGDVLAAVPRLWGLTVETSRTKVGGGVPPVLVFSARVPPVCARLPSVIVSIRLSFAYHLNFGGCTMRCTLYRIV